MEPRSSLLVGCLEGFLQQWLYKALSWKRHFIRRSSIERTCVVYNPPGWWKSELLRASDSVCSFQRELCLVLLQGLQDDPHWCQASDRHHGSRGDHFQRGAGLRGRFPHRRCGRWNLSWAPAALRRARQRIGSVQSSLRPPKLLTLNLTSVTCGCNVLSQAFLRKLCCRVAQP